MTIVTSSSDIDTETEERLLKTSSSEEEAESPLDIASLYEKDTTKFTVRDINTKKYWKEVRRIIYNKMDVNHLDDVYFLNFPLKFERNGGNSCKRPDPSFDAWSLVTGRCRDIFNHNDFFKMYPSLKDQIKYIRKECRMRITDKY